MPTMQAARKGGAKVVPISRRSLRHVPPRTVTGGVGGISGTGVPIRRTQKTARLLNVYGGVSHPGPKTIGTPPPAPVYGNTSVGVGVYPALRGVPMRARQGINGLYKPLSGVGHSANSGLGLGSFAPASTEAIKAGGGALSVVAAGSSWIPIIGPAIAAVTLGISALFGRQSGKQKLAATQVAEAAQREMVKNLQAYQTGPRTKSSQAQAMANFQAAWDFVLMNCGNPDMGDAGRRCIDERRPGGKFDWHRAYLNPIVEDTGVRADPTVVEQAQSVLGFGGGAGSTVGGIDTGTLLLLAGGGLAIWYFLSK